VERVSIVIPAFNEEECIENTIQDTAECMKSSDFEFDVLVVDDGSTDRTPEILEGITISSLRVIRHETNRGYGAALKTGISNSSSEYVCIIDADGTYPPEYFPQLCQLAFPSDIAK